MTAVIIDGKQQAAQTFVYGSKEMRMVKTAVRDKKQTRMERYKRKREDDTNEKDGSGSKRCG